MPNKRTKMAATVAGGGALLLCPTCMKHYGVVEFDLVEGAKVSNQDLAAAALFSDGARSLIW